MKRFMVITPVYTFKNSFYDDDMDLFDDECKPKNAVLLVRLEIEYNSSSFCLGFLVSNVQNIDNAYLQVKYEDKDEFFRFADELAGQGYNHFEQIT